MNLRNLALVALVSLVASVAHAGSISWSLSASHTAQAGVYSQPFGGVIAPDSGNPFCGICGGCCGTVAVQVTIKHPSQAQIQPYMNLNGNGMTLTSTVTQGDGSLRFTFEGYAAQNNPTVSLHVKSNSGANIVIAPASGHVLSLTAGNGY